MGFSKLIAFFIILSTAATLHAAGITDIQTSTQAAEALRPVGGVILCFTPTDPVKELFWSAVINGVIAVHIMAVMMLLASRASTMGAHVFATRLRWLGWAAAAAMAQTVAAMHVTL